MTHSEVVFAVLVPEDVTSVFGCFGEMIGVLLLLESQVFPTGNLVSHDFEVGKLVDGIGERAGFF